MTKYQILCYSFSHDYAFLYQSNWWSFVEVVPCHLFVMATTVHRGCWNNLIFSNLGLCAACWAHFMCHHELWPTSVSHPFSSLNSSLGFAGGKHYQKITIPIFRLVLQNIAIPCCFPYILFNHYLFSLLSSGWFVISVCGSITVQGTSEVFRMIINWCRVATSNNKST